jgi:hypothetical protein
MACSSPSTTASVNVLYPITLVGNIAARSYFYLITLTTETAIVGPKKFAL